MSLPHGNNWLGQPIHTDDLVIRQTQKSDWNQKIGRVQDDGKVLWFAEAWGYADSPAHVRELDKYSRIPRNTNLRGLIVVDKQQIAPQILRMET